MRKDHFGGLAARAMACTGAGSLVSKLGNLLAAIALLVSLVTLPTASSAQGVLRITNDRGGVLSQRMAEIGRLQVTGQPIEIRNGYCASACTMYLGLPNTCVGRNATFAFHGPARTDRRITRQEWEAWSQTMAYYYPPQLRTWFLRTGRYASTNLINLSGRDMIRMGVRECA